MKKVRFERTLFVYPFYHKMEEFIMASVSRRGNGWRFKISYVDENGKRKYINKQGFRTKTEAVVAAAAIEADIQEAINNPAAKPFVDCFHSWWTTYKKGKRAAVTEYRYDLVENQLRDYFGDTKLETMTSSKYQTFINDYSSTGGKDGNTKRSKETVQKLNGYVRAMCKRLINDGVISSDFTFGVELPTDRDRKKPIKYLELDDFAQVVTYARNHAEFSSLTSVAIYLAAQSGLRIGEVLGLTWSDLDPEAHTISVQRSWDYARTKSFQPTKTPSSVRTVEVAPELFPIMKRVHSQQLAWKMKYGIRDQNDCIFFGSAGKVLSPTACGKTLARIQNECDVPEEKQITFHGLRHTHVSYLLSKGVDIYYISKRLGHSDITITMRVYSHLLDSQRKEQAAKAVSAMEMLFN